MQVWKISKWTLQQYLYLFCRPIWHEFGTEFDKFSPATTLMKRFRPSLSLGSSKLSSTILIFTTSGWLSVAIRWVTVLPPVERPDSKLPIFSSTTGLVPETSTFVIQYEELRVDFSMRIHSLPLTCCAHNVNAISKCTQSFDVWAGTWIQVDQSVWREWLLSRLDSSWCLYKNPRSLFLPGT